MASLEDKFPHLEEFIKSYKTFNTIYEEKKNTDVSFEAIFKRLGLIEKFILIISQELDVERVDKISEKFDKDPNILNQVIDNLVKESEKKNKFFDFNPTEFFLNSSDDSSSDNSSVSSIDDINSKDSSSVSSNEDEETIEENTQLNKMIAKSIIELNMRKQLKDFGIERLDDDENQEEDDNENEEKNNEYEEVESVKTS